MLTGREIRRGDVILGIASSGLHTNGYSLARKILFEKLKLKTSSRLPGLKGTLGAELLKVHVSYGQAVQSLVKRFNVIGEKPAIKGFAHITGGGFVDNIPRVLPKGCDAVIRKGTWEELPIFQLLRERGGVEESELYQVFNMGIGMVTIVNHTVADVVLKKILSLGHPAWIIGEIVNGRGSVRMI